MQTVLIQIENNKAFHLLQELEQLNILKIVDDNFITKKTKISDKYKGVFTKKDAENFNQHTQTMRNEWKVF